eukprot:GFYU01000254.1.p1 GENE.GFYU01000254.1~~GFYU01000254.1.p1  ORF type:complete len:139 (+),score=26.32 GFYU01000254.1:88-504(+)
MAFALAVPLITLIEGLVAEGLLVALGATVAAVTAAELVRNNPALPAKVRQWILDHAAEFDEQAKRPERREPTPVTAPPLFTKKGINGRSVFQNNTTGEVWEADTLHGNHFEVYASAKSFEKGARIRAVWHDGRLKQMF